MRLFYYEAKIIIEVPEKLVTRGGVYFVLKTQNFMKNKKTYEKNVFFTFSAGPNRYSEKCYEKVFD